MGAPKKEDRVTLGMAMGVTAETVKHRLLSPAQRRHQERNKLRRSKTLLKHQEPTDEQGG